VAARGLPGALQPAALDSRPNLHYIDEHWQSRQAASMIRLEIAL